MLGSPIARFVPSTLIGIGILAMATTVPTALAERSELSEASMAEAIQYLGVLSGRELSADDAAWLKGQWAEERQLSAGSVAADVDDLAFSHQRYQRDGDPIRLAEARATIVESAYCAAEQSSSPSAHRLRDVLTSGDLVLAADCVLGLVVTRFDADGLVASHALIASATGQDHDIESDRAEITIGIVDGFADAAPSEKMLLANGELRHAVLGRFWDLIDGSPEQRAVVQEIAEAAAVDLKTPARQLEALALSKLDEMDYLVRVGDDRLTVGAIMNYEQWLERIAGYGFSDRDQDWLEQAIIEEFKTDSKKVLNEIASIRTANRDYTLTDTAEEKNRLAAFWAVDFYCYLSASDDPDEIHLAEVVFRENPVIDADCQAGTIQRQSQAVLVESGDQRLLEQDLDVSMRFLAMVLGRPLLPEETAVVREDNIKSFKGDPIGWQEEEEKYRALLANVDKHDKSLFLAIDERKKLFDPIYCAVKSSNEPYAKDYLAMFERGDAVLFDDCDKQLVTTEEEIQAVVSVANFLALLNDKPPLDADTVEELRESFKSQYIGEAESTMLALQEWWSLLSLEEKAAEAERAKAEGITIEADGEKVKGYVDSAKLQVVLRNAKIDSCRMSSIIIQGQTAIFAARHGPYTASANNPLGISGVELGGVISTSNALAELCKGM